MKKFLKVRSIATAIVAILVATAFAGCNKSAEGNQESKESSLSTPSATVSEVTSVAEPSKVESSAESSVEEKSKEKSKAESSIDEKSKEESKAESSVEEKSKEESKTERSVVEKSEVESSVESSVEEKSGEESKTESSLVESSVETSQAESSIQESSTEVSMSSEDVFASIPFYDGDGIDIEVEDIVCYGHTLTDIPLSNSSSIPKGSLIAILGKSRAEGNVDIAIGWNFSLIAKINDIEFLPLDYITTSGEELYFPF